MNTPVLWYLLLSVLLLGVIVLLLAIVFRRPKQQPLDSSADAEVEIPATGHLQTASTASNALFATLSHELRTPLNGLLGLDPEPGPRRPLCGWPAREHSTSQLPVWQVWEPSKKAL